MNTPSLEFVPCLKHQSRARLQSIDRLRNEPRLRPFIDLSKTTILVCRQSPPSRFPWKRGRLRSSIALRRRSSQSPWQVSGLRRALHQRCTDLKSPVSFLLRREPARQWSAHCKHIGRLQTIRRRRPRCHRGPGSVPVRNRRPCCNAWRGRRSPR